MEQHKTSTDCNNAIGSASSTDTSITIIELTSPEREQALQIRVSAPVTGINLPVILFAHGFGSSMYGYDPLVEFWSANGFVVIQPTFPDSKTLLGIPNATHQDAINAYLKNPRSKHIWRERVKDMKFLLDQLNYIEQTVPGLSGRLDLSHIAAVGHSFGAHTVGLLLGARVIGPDGYLEEDMSDKRINAAVLLSAGGRGGDALSDFAKANFSYLNQTFAQMQTPALVVAGDHDQSPLTVLGPEWFMDIYRLSPGANALLTLFGGEHMLGGITGYLAEETTDENPERVAAVARVGWAYLRSVLVASDQPWANEKAKLTVPNPIGNIEIK
ncbi:alpha/beta hydrolase family protein [Mucilaginibacter lacusdianchii]|uniref:alpha/beta hydrolase family protein n=1 Tax=Mucilaginibacter lacusdianchii TaxID=2684211 RepID=UPI00131B9A82|nr:chlorophyllase [Mucilaginibacter sp. JXJ CY 39]